MTDREYLNLILNDGKIDADLQKQIEMHIRGDLPDLPTQELDEQFTTFHAGGGLMTVRTERGSWKPEIAEHYHASVSIGPVGCDFWLIGVTPVELEALGNFLLKVAKRYAAPATTEHQS